MNYIEAQQQNYLDRMETEDDFNFSFEIELLRDEATAWRIFDEKEKINEIFILIEWLEKVRIHCVLVESLEFSKN